jgi:hypothetical protein
MLVILTGYRQQRMYEGICVREVWITGYGKGKGIKRGL